MIALDLCPVIHELVLVLLLGQWTIAVTLGLRAKSISEGKQSIIREKARKIRHSRRICLVRKIESHRACILGGRGSESALCHIDPIPEPTEAEVRQQSGAKRVIKASRQALIPNF